MTIRPATMADTAAITGMATRFLGPEGPYAGLFTPSVDAIAKLIERVAQPTAFALVLQDGDHLVGMFGAFLMDHPMTGALIACELCWWVNPEVRGGIDAVRLLHRGEQWAAEKGAAQLIMVAPNERVGYFYERLGYTRADINYRKELRT